MTTRLPERSPIPATTPAPTPAPAPGPNPGFDAAALAAYGPSLGDYTAEPPSVQGPTPGAQGPTPGAQGPTPGAQGPTPGAQGPTPGAQGPTPGAQGPTPGTQGATLPDEVSGDPAKPSLWETMSNDIQMGAEAATRDKRRVDQVEGAVTSAIDAGAERVQNVPLLGRAAGRLAGGLDTVTHKAGNLSRHVAVGLDMAGGFGDAFHHGVDALSGTDGLITRGVDSVHGWSDRAQATHQGDGLGDRAARYGAQGVDAVTQSAGGIAMGGLDLADGVVNLVTHPLNVASGLETMAEHIPMPYGWHNPLQWAHGKTQEMLGEQTQEQFEKSNSPEETSKDNSKFWSQFRGAVGKPYQEAWAKHEYGEAVARGATGLVSALVGGGEAKGASEAGEAAAAAGKAGGIGKWLQEHPRTHTVLKAGEKVGEKGEEMLKDVPFDAVQDITRDKRSEEFKARHEAEHKAPHGAEGGPLP